MAWRVCAFFTPINHPLSTINPSRPSRIESCFCQACTVSCQGWPCFGVTGRIFLLPETEKSLHLLETVPRPLAGFAYGQENPNPHRDRQPGAAQRYGRNHAPDFFHAP